MALQVLTVKSATHGEMVSGKSIGIPDIGGNEFQGPFPGAITLTILVGLVLKASTHGETVEKLATGILAALSVKSASHDETSDRPAVSTPLLYVKSSVHGHIPSPLAVAVPAAPPVVVPVVTAVPTGGGGALSIGRVPRRTFEIIAEGVGIVGGSADVQFVSSDESITVRKARRKDYLARTLLKSGSGGALAGGSSDVVTFRDFSSGDEELLFLLAA